MDEPKFQHDCDKCEFLGCFQDRDLYACRNSLLGISLLVRFGNGGYEYASVPVSIWINRSEDLKQMPDGLVMAEAYRRLLERS